MAINEPPSLGMNSSYPYRSETLPIWTWTDQNEELERADTEIEILRAQVRGSLEQIVAWENEVLRVLKNDSTKGEALKKLSLAVMEAYSKNEIDAEFASRLITMVQEGVTKD